MADRAAEAGGLGRAQVDAHMGTRHGRLVLVPGASLRVPDVGAVAATARPDRLGDAMDGEVGQLIAEAAR